MPISVRRATLADAPLLKEWRLRPHVATAFGNEAPPNWAEELQIKADWHDPVIAEDDGRPIGYVEIIDPAREEGHYWGAVEENLRALDIFVADEADLGKGYGAEMMRLALARCFNEPRVKAVIIDPLASNTRAIRFYERLGFAHEAPRRFDDGNECAIMRMTREDWATRSALR
ncbi:MAG: GNAT family N-acetyltransferase [Pseudomonadota bacterium]